MVGLDNFQKVGTWREARRFPQIAKIFYVTSWKTTYKSEF